MKKFIAVSVALTLLTFSSAVFSGGPGGNHYRNNHQHRPHVHHHNHHRHWVAPLIIGGAVGYALTRPYYYTYPYVEPDAYYAPPPACTRYVYQDQNGNVLKEEVRCN